MIRKKLIIIVSSILMLTMAQESMAEKSDFIIGFKMKNLEGIEQKTEVTFKLAKELNLDYILKVVAIHRLPDGGWDWYGKGKREYRGKSVKSHNHQYIMELSKKYDIPIIPAFYRGRGNDSAYVDLIVSYLDKFKKEGRIK